jgi:DNA polymerase elongation subunit (family B)
MQELWIKDQSDLTEFLSFIQDERLSVQYVGKDNDGLNMLKVGDYIVHAPVYLYDPGQVKLGKILPQKEVIQPTKDVVSQKQYDPLIFGKDSTEYITNITVDNDNVYIYKSDDSVQIQEYMNWAVGANWAEGSQRLKGHQYFKYIKELPEDQWYNLKDNWNPRVWTPRTASEGFMLRSGMTYYKGMKVSDVSLLSFDIEATTLDKDDPDAKVVLVSMTYRNKTGKIEKYLFDIFDYEQSTDMWNDLNSWVKVKNPDIILGHNILSYDLPYLNKNSSGLKWGKENTKVIFDSKESKIRKDGQQQYKFFNANINGREIVDTFFLSLKYDIGREFPSYGLKAIEKHLGLVKEDRSWDFQTWSVKKLVEAKSKGNHEIWQKFREYCQDDSDSPIKMFDIMIPSFFYLCQSVPKTLQQMINEASGSQLDSLMIRSYLQDGYSLPKSSPKEEFEGAVSMGVPGVYKNVRKVDVASLYPSIMLQYQIYDNKKDPNRNMLKMLEYFRNERLANKKLAKDTGEKYYDDLQNSQKIMINSMYGFMGAGYLLFNYPFGAAEVTRHGREILLKGVEWATGHTLTKVVKSVRNEGTDDAEEKFHWILGDKVSSGLGYQLVNVDTDSFSYTNNIAPSKDDFKKEIQELNSLYPELIKWEDDGVYDGVIVVKAKNYVLVKNGKTKYKGSSLTDQKKEPRLIKLLEDFLTVLLTDEPDKEKELIGVYNDCCREVVNNFNVFDWVTKKTVTKSILKPERANEQKPLNAINEAIKKSVISGIQEGDKVWLYLALDGERPKMAKGEPVILKKTGQPSMIPNDVYRFPELWNGKDQYVKHYLERIYDTAVILENVVDINKFTKYHSAKGQKLLENLK